MIEVDVRNVRLFRLHTHGLNARRTGAHIPAAVGACGMQNTPPGAWETALFNRISNGGVPEMNTLLYENKTLLQAWSFRGAPVVFPTEESPAFLGALVPENGEEWIYTHGIALALDFLKMPFEELLDKLREVMPALDGKTVESKQSLDETLAEWMAPLIPKQKRALWGSPSLYGAGGRQTLGGAVVSFLLRPCSFLGLVVFGKRRGASPTFTSYKSWLGRPLKTDADAAGRLTRKFLHCYGPATTDMFARWLGCTGRQARRMWQSVADEIEPVAVCGKRAYILAADKPLLCAAPAAPRKWLLLGGHDPYLDQRDRHVLLDDKARRQKVWQTVSNPGAVLREGEVIGTWAGKKQAMGMEINITLWGGASQPGQAQKLAELAEEYAAFRGQKLVGVHF